MEIPVLVSLIFWGLYYGCVYVLLATGLNVIFGVMKAVNFAHGEIMVLGAYITYWIWALLGINPYLGTLLSMVILALIGAAIQRLCFRPILGTGKLNEIFISVALIYVLQNLIASLWASDERRIVSPYEAVWIPLGLFNLPMDYIIAMLLTVVILLGLFVFFRRTWTGRALRATSQNREAATLMGVNVEQMDTLSFSLGCMLAAVAGTFLGMLSFSPYAGALPAIASFAVIILGGLGSIPGAIIGGLLIGLTEALTGFFFGGAWKIAAVFIVFTIVLSVRPTGIFGEAAE